MLEKEIMKRLTLIIIYMSAQLVLGHSSTSRPNTSDSIVFTGEFVTSYDPNGPTANAAYQEKISSIAHMGLDEKCANGHDIGIGLHEYTPYVKIEQNDARQFIASGIFPHITKQLVRNCCPKSNITFCKIYPTITDIRDGIEEDSNSIDILYPVYGQDGKKSTYFKDFPFIPIVTAPKIVLVVQDQLFQERNTRMAVVMNTVFNAWPLLAFLTVSAMLAGLIIWILDFRSNPDEFPSSFFAGSWEGIWWAFVTMTTVGYGDRSPKSTWARAFCILWILTGIVLISLFTGLVTSALSASSTPVYNIPGSKIGAVYGSIEYQVGVGLNAEMKSFKSQHQLLDAIRKQDGTVHSVMLDNFVLSARADIFKGEKLRMEREIDHPVTYGMVIAQNSSRIETCIRRYVRWHPEKIFDIIADKLVPIKNPTDDIRLEVAAAEKVFYEQDLFKWIVYSEIGVFLVAFFVGVFWELRVRNRDRSTHISIDCFKRKNSPHQSFALVKSCDASKKLPEELQSMVTEYNDFHSMWVEKVIHMCNSKSSI